MVNNKFIMLLQVFILFFSVSISKSWAVAPAAPTVSASQGTYSSSVNIMWNCVVNAASYDVYRAPTSSGPWTKIFTQNTPGGCSGSTNGSDSSVGYDTQYYYGIIALSSTAESSPASNIAVGWGGKPVPLAVTGMNASQGTSTTAVNVSWSASTYASQYDLYRSTSSGSKGSAIASNLTGTSYSDSSLSTGTHYYYTVVAKNNTGSSPDSAQAEGWLLIPVPNMVTGLTATQGTLYGKVTVSWSSASGATQYDVYRSSVSGTKGSIVASNLSGTSYDNTGLTDSTHYFYTVVAKNAAGYSPDSSQSAGWGKIPGSATLTATKSTVDNAVQLSWTAVTDATSYQVYRASSSGGSGTLLATLASTTFTDSTSGYNVLYYYKIIALADTAAGASSNEDVGWGKVVAPSQVSGLTATQGTFYGKVTLSWPPSDSNLTRYYIYKSTEPGTKGSIVVTNFNGTSYDNIGLTDSTHYFYTVVAKNAAGYSPDSAQAEGWGKIPGSSTLTATQGTVENAVQLSWSAVTDATSYQIYRASSSGELGTLLATETSTSFTDSTSGYGLGYYYKIIALADTAAGASSNEAVGWGKVVAPLQISGLTATQGTLYGKVTVSWSPASGATQYDVYRSSVYGTKGSLVALNLFGTSYDNTGLHDSTHYFYTIVAKNAAGSSPDSAQAEGWGQMPGSATLTATQGTIDNAVQLSWSAVTDTTSYQVYRASSSGGAMTLLGTVSSTTFTDSTSGYGAAYYYNIIALVGTAAGALSNEASGWGKSPTPLQVTGLTATQGTLYGKVTVSWSPASGATQYDVYRSSVSGTKGSLVTSNLSGTSYDNTGLTDSTHYFYTVVAKNGAGSSPDSAQAVGWGKTLAVVSSLTATQGTVTDGIRLIWTANPDATSYDVYRSTTSGGTYVVITNVSTNTYQDTQTNTTIFFYKVIAKTPGVSSAFSNEASGWANRAITAATVADIVTDWQTTSNGVNPSIMDPNMSAGQEESFTFTITSQPAVGSVAIVSGKFVFTPPADGTFSGDQNFGYKVTDKGGAFVTGTGAIHVACAAPRISLFSVIENNILPVSSFTGTAKFSLPNCGSNGQFTIDVLDQDNTVLLSGTPTTVSNGTDITKNMILKGPLKSGNYLTRITVQNNKGTVTATSPLIVDTVVPPMMAISPDLTVVSGVDTVNATLSNPGNANCQFVSDQDVAINNTQKCFVKFDDIPPGMVADTRGTLPLLSGVVSDDGNYPITANVYRFDGVTPIKVASVTTHITTTCDAPIISSLTAPDGNLPHLEPTYTFKYTANTCNDALNTTLNIYKGTGTQGDIVQTLPITLSDYGANKTFSITGIGLEEGDYTADATLKGSAGTGKKSVTFNVKSVPLPSIVINYPSAAQLETKVQASISPSADRSCPLTADQAAAQNDPTYCFVAISDNVPGLSLGVGKNSLPILSGYPATVGDYTISATISRWVKGTRYDLPVPPAVLSVTPTEPMQFTIIGNDSAYLGIDTVEFEVKQTKGLNCALQTNLDKAKSLATIGTRSCYVSFTVPSEMTPSTNALNQAKASGIFMITGDKTVSYKVTRVFADESTWDIADGQATVNIKDLPAPLISFSGGKKITEDKYYVEQGQPVTKMTVDAGIPSRAKLKITVIDSGKSTERLNMMSGSAYWVNANSLTMLEERPITVRVAWMGYPSVFTERTLTAVGGAESNLRLITDAPQKVSDTENFKVKVKIGKYIKNNLVYTPETMGQWRTQILAQTNTQSVKTPVTDIKDMVNGEAEFEINPAGNLYMKLTAVSELISNVDGLDSTVTSTLQYVEVGKGSPIEGTITSKSWDGPAPKTFTLELNMSQDNRVATKEVTWEESQDEGATWAPIKNSNTIRHNVSLSAPDKRQVRAKMVNKNTLLESYTAPVEVWAYAKVAVSITGPNFMAPNYTATLAGELLINGVPATDTVNEWTIQAPSGTTTITGTTATITESKEGKVYITLKSRPADTRADDINAWTAAKFFISVKIPTKPSVNAKGPREVEIGKTYHYDGTVRPSWEGGVSVNTTKSEWQLPDGSIVSGNSLDWVPAPQDLVAAKPLVFRAWVDGFKDSTINETTINYVPWEYVWPNFTISMKQLSVQAPSDIIMTISQDRPDMGRRFEGLTYEWSYPDNVTGRQNEAFPYKSVAQVLYAGEYDITATIRDARGHQTMLTQHVVAEQAIPYNVTLKVGKSNVYDRAPMTVTVRPTISGGHPLDSIIDQIWQVDGVMLDAFSGRDYMTYDITNSGNHVIGFTLKSKMGETSTFTSPLSLVQNKPPVCELLSKPTVYMAYAEAKCTDSDGKVIGYSWQVNDQPIGSTSYRISFNKTSTPQSVKVTITAMDDAKDLSTPVSINLDY